MTSVPDRFVEALLHHFPNAKSGADYAVENVPAGGQGSFAGLGPQLTFWNTATLGPQWTQADFDAEIVLIEAEKTKTATITNDGNRIAFINLLATGSRDEIVNSNTASVRSDTITNLRADLLSLINKLSLAMSFDHRK